MTISSEVNKSGPYTGDGSNTSFAYGFKVYDKTELQVIHTVIATGVETVLTVDVDYTVNSVGSATGTITYPISGSPLPSTEKLTIVRDMTLTQEVDLENQGGYYPDVVEKALDRIVMAQQQHEEVLDRAVKVNASSSTTPDQLMDDIDASVLAAATSESNAATSETNAAASETAAAASAASAASDAVSTAADAVSTAADVVSTAADVTSSGTNATNAASSASAASTSETNAAASESAASTSETNAAASESAAATSETNAAASETAAAASAAAAAASYDSFDDRYLGSKTSDPTLDNDGNALLTGALYWNSSSDVLKVYDGSGWNSYGAASGAFETQLLHVQDQKTSGSNAGTNIAGYNVRVLNTVLTNEISGAALGSTLANRITLPAGTYYIEARAPGYRVDNHKAILYDETNSANVLVGSNEYNYSVSAISTVSFISGRFTLTGTTDLYIKHYTKTVSTNAGLGAAASIGNTEVYSDVKIWRVA